MNMKLVGWLFVVAGLANLYVGIPLNSWFHSMNVINLVVGVFTVWFGFFVMRGGGPYDLSLRRWLREHKRHEADGHHLR